VIPPLSNFHCEADGGRFLSLLPYLRFCQRSQTQHPHQEAIANPAPCYTRRCLAYPFTYYLSVGASPHFLLGRNSFQPRLLGLTICHVIFDLLRKCNRIACPIGNMLKFITTLSKPCPSVEMVSDALSIDLNLVRGWSSYMLTLQGG